MTCPYAANSLTAANYDLSDSDGQCLYPVAPPGAPLDGSSEVGEPMVILKGICGLFSP